MSTLNAPEYRQFLEFENSQLLIKYNHNILRLSLELENIAFQEEPQKIFYKTTGNFVQKFTMIKPFSTIYQPAHLNK